MAVAGGFDKRGEHITRPNALTSSAALGFHGAMPMGRSLARVLSLVSIAALAGFLLASIRLGTLERGGPPHADLSLEGGVPATLFLPPASGDPLSAFTNPLPPDQRPPALILGHGISSDRTNLSSLARRLAESGFAVLTLDLRGHGENRNPFPIGRARADALAPDFAAAVDFLRTSPLVDGSRIAVAGHSMGAGAALDFATRDSGLDAVVAISSGSSSLLGPQRPPNVLFIFAAGDPERVKTRSAALASKLAGGTEPALGSTSGDFRQGTALRRVEIPGADHATIVWSDAAFSEIVAWLDSAFGREPSGASAPRDPRGRVVALLAVLMVLVLPGLGLLIGGLTPTSEHLADAGRPLGLLVLAAVLTATMPLVSFGKPGAILAVEIGDEVVAHFGLAGIALLLILYLRDRARFGSLFAAPGRSLLGAALAMIAVYFLLQPFGVYLHGLALTPERLWVFALATLGLLPLALAREALLRRGSPLSAGLFSAAGRAVVLLVLIAGVMLGLIAPVVMLMIPALALVFVLVEILASSFYLASRNLLAIGLIDAAWLGLVVAAIMPVRI
jgi:dienelactone hydrolase